MISIPFLLLPILYPLLECLKTWNIIPTITEQESLQCIGNIFLFLLNPFVIKEILLSNLMSSVTLWYFWSSPFSWILGADWPLERQAIFQTVYAMQIWKISVVLWSMSHTKEWKMTLNGMCTHTCKYESGKWHYRIWELNVFSDTTVILFNAKNISEKHYKNFVKHPNVFQLL